jgi:hypothetical protein
MEKYSILFRRMQLVVYLLNLTHNQVKYDQERYHTKQNILNFKAVHPHLGLTPFPLPTVL